MQVLILEDEKPAQQQLVHLLQTHYPQAEVAALLDSVETAAKWLQTHTPHLIFMDVELSDGVCFELFNRVSVTSPVIITTAYEHYALHAIKKSCVDYLLKPIDPGEFVNAVEKCRLQAPKVDWTRLQEWFKGADPTPTPHHKTRFTVKVGEQIFIIPTLEIAYFYSEDKSTYMVTHQNKRYLTDLSLEAIEAQVPARDFFKISRNCLAGIRSIDGISKYFNSRLRITLKPAFNGLLLVSRARVAPFMDWVEGNS